jgi:hypothetical protein
MGTLLGRLETEQCTAPTGGAVCPIRRRSWRAAACPPWGTGVSTYQLASLGRTLPPEPAGGVAKSHANLRQQAFGGYR